MEINIGNKDMCNHYRQLLYFFVVLAVSFSNLSIADEYAWQSVSDITIVDGVEVITHSYHETHIPAILQRCRTYTPIYTDYLITQICGTTVAGRLCSNDVNDPSILDVDYYGGRCRYQDSNGVFQSARSFGIPYVLLSDDDFCPEGEVVVFVDGLADCAVPELEPEDDPNKDDDPCDEHTVGNPCQVATGTKFQSETDLVGALPFTRYYNSRNLVSLNLGRGWRHNYQSKLIITNENSLVYTSGRGRGEVWTKSNGSWIGDPDSKVALTESAMGFQIEKFNGDIEQYSLEGQILSLLTTNGDQTSYSYDGVGRLIQVSNTYGVAVNFTYSGDKLETVSDDLGNVYRYEYDSNDNLASVTYPDTTPADDSDNPRRIYHYEDSNFPNHLTGITDENGDRFGTYVYDSMGRAFSSEHAVTTNVNGQEKVSLSYGAGNINTVTDAAGNKVDWSFQDILGSKKLTSKTHQSDSKGITQTWDANGNLLTRTDAEGRTTAYVYNAANQRTSMTEAFGTPVARTTLYEYVSADVDLITRTIMPSVYGSNNKEVVNTYDINNNITAVTISGFDLAGSAISRSSNFQHDSYGKITQINGPRTDVDDITILEYYDCTTGAECGQLKKVTNALGHETTYDIYDAAARLKQMTGANGVVTTYDYHPRGWVLSVTQTPPIGTARVTTYEYDAVGQMIKTTLPDGSEQNYVYDEAHDLREISDNLGNKVEYTYDARGNRTHEFIKDSDGSLVMSLISSFDERNFIDSINAAGSITQMVNNAVGNLIAQTDPNQNPSTTNNYDALDRLISAVDALTNTSSYSYNVADQLINVTAPNGAVTSYEYDDLGNQTKEVSADRGTLIYSHDAAGNVVSLTDARGITANYTYDELNRLTTITYPSISEQVTYTYDLGCAYPVGRLCEVSDDSGLTSYDYDVWGNVVRHEKSERDDTEAVIGTYVTEYEYDFANRVTQMTYPSGRTVYTARDAIGRVTSQGTIDNASQFTLLVSNRAYRADGLLVSQTIGSGTLGTGLTELRGYDQQGRLQVHSVGDYSRVYSYDNNGNVVSRSSMNGTYDVGYGYDALDRLDQSYDVIHSLVRGFSYDANGNRTLATEGLQSSALYYDANSNRLNSVDGSALSIDASGRTLSDNQGRVFSYNDAGRLASVHINGQLVGEYTYNSQQQRTQKHSQGVTTVYSYDLFGNLIAESNRLGEIDKEYLYTDGNRIALVQYDNTINMASHEAWGEDTANGTVTVENDGKQIIMTGNRWRSVPFRSKVTSSSILEFEFKSDVQGEVHALGLIGSTTLPDFTIQPWGTEAWATLNFNNYPGDGQFKNYSFPIGAMFPQGGEFHSLALVMDDDANQSGQSVFRNVKVYEPNAPESKIHFYINDHLGTPQRLVGPGYMSPSDSDTPYDSNAISWQADYEAFGEVLISREVVVNNHRFPGQYYDQETGLHYNWNRYYDPKTGRYVTHDPIGLAGGLNSYSYALENPIKYYDANGENPRFAYAAGGYAGRRVIGPGINRILGALTGTASLGAVIYNATHPDESRWFDVPNGPEIEYGENDGHPNDRGRSKPVKHPQAQEEHDAYYDAYNELMPPGLDPCAQLRWQLTKAQELLAAKKAWDQRWNPYRHSDNYWQIRRQIKNIKKRMNDLGCEVNCP